MKRSIGAILAPLAAVLALPGPSFALPPSIAPVSAPSPSSSSAPTSTASTYSSVATRAPTSVDDETRGYFDASSIDSAYQSTAGVGCSGTPVLTLSAPNGTGGVQATAKLVVFPTGGTGVQILEPGTGYTANPTYTLTGLTCTTNPVLKFSYAQDGQFWNSPQGLFQMGEHTAGAAEWVFTPVAKYPVDAVAKPATALAIVAGGAGYAVGDTVTLPNGTVATVATVSSGAIASVTLTTAGNWPCPPSTPQSQTATSGSGTGATFTLTTATPVFAGGTRRLTACYTANAAMDIVRASDSNSLTLGFVNDTLDIQSASNFCANTTCKVSRLYDQGGAANHAVQATAANRCTLDLNHNTGNTTAIYCGGYLTIPSTAAAVQSNMSMFELGRAFSSGAEYLGQFGNTYIISTGMGQPYYSSAPSITVGYANDEEPTVWSVSSGSTSNAMFTANDFEAQCTSSCTYATSYSGGTVGSTNMAGVVGAEIVFPRGLSNTEIANVRSSIYSAYNIYPQARDIYVADGDSRTYGFGYGATDGLTWPLQTEKLLPGPTRIFDTGHGGYTAAQMLSIYYSNVAPIFLQPHGKNVINTVWSGFNDGQASTPAATAYSTLSTYIADAHALGVKVGVATEPSGAIATALTALVQANSGGADFIMPLAADQGFYSPGTSYLGGSALFYFASPHPSVLGYGFVAQDVAKNLVPALQ